MGLMSACDRKGVDKSVKDFNACDELAQHTLQALLVSALINFLKLPDGVALDLSRDGATSAYVNDNSHHFAQFRTTQDVEAVARDFVTYHFRSPRLESKEDTKDGVLVAARGLMGHLFDYVEFREAVRYEDSERIFRMWRILIPVFLGANKTNYAGECVRLFVNLLARWSKFDSYVAIQNSTVNVSGVEGKGKPNDLLQEHINRTIKVPLKESGSNYSESHGVTLSLVAPYLDRCCRQLEEQTGATYNTSRHSDPKVEEDIRRMIHKLQVHKVFSFEGEERMLGWSANSYTADGYRRIEGKSQWLLKLLQKLVDAQENGLIVEEDDDLEDEDPEGNGDDWGDIEDLFQ